jgi:hypothetical protein
MWTTCGKRAEEGPPNGIRKSVDGIRNTEYRSLFRFRGSSPYSVSRIPTRQGTRDRAQGTRDKGQERKDRSTGSRTPDCQVNWQEGGQLAASRNAQAGVKEGCLPSRRTQEERGCPVKSNGDAMRSPRVFQANPAINPGCQQLEVPLPERLRCRSR